MHSTKVRNQNQMEQPHQHPAVNHLPPTGRSCLSPTPPMLLRSSSTTQCSLPAQPSKYLSIDCAYDVSFDCFGFWQEHRRTLDKLYFPAIRALSVPASSSPIEHVFSKGYAPDFGSIGDAPFGQTRIKFNCFYCITPFSKMGRFTANTQRITCH